MKTLADLKRKLAIGTKLIMVTHDWYPTGKLIGLKRKIIEKNTVGIYFEGGSFLSYPKATEVEFISTTTFKVALDFDKGEYMTYEIVS